MKGPIDWRTRLRMHWRMLGQAAATFAVGFLGGYGAMLLHVPLPWMLGSLAVTAALSIAGLPTRSLGASRSLGQILIAASVGLAFTPDAVRALLGDFPLMVGFGAVTILFALLVAAGMTRLFRISPVLGCLSCLPLGPIEAANLAQRHGLPEAPVVFAQTLRIVLIVFTVPPALFWIGHASRDGVTDAANPVNAGFLLLVSGATVSAILFSRLRMPNATFLGALSFSACASAFGLPVSGLPPLVSWLAQVMLGVSLGVTVERSLLRSSGNLMLSASCAGGLLITCCVLASLPLAGITGQPWNTMLLAATPGSLAEISLTAKLLHLDVATVTGFHAVRIYMVLLLSPLLILVVKRLGRSP